MDHSVLQSPTSPSAYEKKPFAAPVRLAFATTLGNKFDLPFLLTSTVGDVRRAVAEKLNMPVRSFHLTQKVPDGTKVLSDDTVSVLDAGLRDGSVISVAPAARSGLDTQATARVSEHDLAKLDPAALEQMLQFAEGVKLEIALANGQTVELNLTPQQMLAMTKRVVAGEATMEKVVAEAVAGVMAKSEQPASPKVEDKDARRLFEEHLDRIREQEKIEEAKRKEAKDMARKIEALQAKKRRAANQRKARTAAKLSPTPATASVPASASSTTVAMTPVAPPVTGFAGLRRGFLLAMPKRT